MNQTRQERILWLKDKLAAHETQRLKWAEELSRLEETERFHAAKREERRLRLLDALGIADDAPEDEAPRQMVKDLGKSL